MKVCIRKEGFVQLPTDRYWVKVVSIVFQKAWKEYGPALEWVFEVMRGRHRRCRLNGKTNLTNSLGPRGKFGRWYFALTGIELKEGQEVDTDALIGKCCWAEITAFRSANDKPANEIDLVADDPPDGDEGSRRLS